MTPAFRTSRPHESVLPRAQSGYTREHTHGPLIGMDDGEAFLERAKAFLPKLFVGLVIAGAVLSLPVLWHLGWFAWSLV